MKRSVVLFFFLLSIFSHGLDAKTCVYLFPGLGSDSRIFSKINLDSSFEIIQVEYPFPEKGTSLREFARLIGKQIDTTQKYIFIGVSLGGMICSELSDIFHPEKTIIISSVKCSQELPFRCRLQKVIPFYKIIPSNVIKWTGQVLQPIMEPDRKKEKEVFANMFKGKDPRYLKRTADMIMSWDHKNYCKDIIHIHGTKDRTLPIHRIKVNYPIDNGSHVMTLTRGEEINSIVQFILSETFLETKK